MSWGQIQQFISFLLALSLAFTFSLHRFRRRCQKSKRAHGFQSFPPLPSFVSFLQIIVFSSFFRIRHSTHSHTHDRTNEAAGEAKLATPKRKRGKGGGGGWKRPRSSNRKAEVAAIQNFNQPPLVNTELRNLTKKFIKQKSSNRL